MGHNTMKSMEKSPVQAPARRTSRLFYIDNLRVALVLLVVLHHVAMVYGASAPFYYTEPPLTDPLGFLLLLVFALFNQAWFMGAFFLLAGYFTPGAFDRKGPGSFLKDRLIRLGIPIMVFYFVLSPISFLGLYEMPSSHSGITSPFSWEKYPQMLGMGPTWFIAMLLIFSIGYAGWRMLTSNRPMHTMSDAPLPSFQAIVGFTLALALASFLVRIAIPLGKELLGFPTLAYLPQYLSFFVIGTVASRRDWFRRLPASIGTAGLATAVVAGLIFFPLAFSGEPFSLELTPALGNAFGNGHRQSASYALWDSFFAVGICLGLITLFRRFLNGQGEFGRFLARHGYAVYIFHIPIIVLIAIALRGFDLPGLLKFGLASVIVVPACFAAAFVIRKIPGISKIL